MVGVNPKKDPMRVEFYEGLVRKTASKWAWKMEFEDLCQVLRLKVFQALQSYDPARATQTVDGYVFSCVRNRIKDLGEIKVRDDLYIEDIAPSSAHYETGGSNENVSRDNFEGRYLIEEEEHAFAEILTETPLIPDTLTEVEARVVVCLYLELTQAEIAERLVMSRREVARSVKQVKVKMAAWRPTARNGDGGVPHREEQSVDTSDQEHLPESR